MSSDGKRHSGRCYVCHEQGDDLVWDEDLESLRHEDCSLSSVAARLPVTIRDLKCSIKRAEELVLSPDFLHPYREAWTTLRRSAHRALEDLQRLEIPPARPVEQILGEIIAEGHVEVTLEYKPWRLESRRWDCQTELDVERKSEEESWEAHAFRAQRGSAEGTSAVEVAETRLREIRAGKGLAVLVSWFLPVVDVEIREAPVGTGHDAEACADRSGLGDDDALPDQIEEI